MGISEMAVIFMSLGVAPANFKVADMFRRNRLGDTTVDVGFERGFVVDCAPGWDMDDEEQMEEVDQRVRDEEPVLLIGSPMCRAFSTLIELTRATRKVSRGQVQEPCGAMRKNTSSFASGCTRHSGMQEVCSCMNIRGMRDLAASVSSMKWRRRTDEQCREGILVHVKLRVFRRGVEHALLKPKWAGRELHEQLCVGCVDKPEEGD